MYSCVVISPLSLHSIRLFYAAYFAAMGLLLPYFPVYLTNLGMNTLWVGVFVGLLAAAKVIAPPLSGWFLEQRGTNTRTFLLFCSALAALTAATLLLPLNLGLMCISVLLFGFFWAAVLPLTDGVSLVIAEIALISYGRLRAWGSLGFVFASLAGGVYLVEGNIHLFPIMLTILLIIATFAALGFPNLHDLKQHPSQQTTHHNSSNPKALAWLMVTGFCMQASHGAYYGFFSLYMLDVGYSGTNIGIFWIIGVLAEIVLMWYWSKPIQQASPVLVLGTCLALAALRWLGLAFTDTILAIIILQLLHAASFAAFHLSAVTWVRRFACNSRQTSAQGWYSSLGFGLGSTLGIMLCGYIVQHHGYPLSFIACSMIAILGLYAVWQLHVHQHLRKSL